MLHGRGGRPIDRGGACCHHRRPPAAAAAVTTCLVLLSTFHRCRYDPRVMRHVLFTETKLK